MHRKRLVTVATLLAVLVGCSTVVRDVSPDPSALAPTGSIVEAGRVVATIDVPNDGHITFDGSSVWVVDRQDGVVVDGVPAGVLYRIDPQAEEIAAEIHGVVGAMPEVGEGAVWLVTLAGGLDALTRVDLETSAVTMIRTAAGDDAQPWGIAILPGRVWVSNAHDGTVVRIDPDTLEISATIQVTDPGEGGPKRATTNGSDLWVHIPRERTILRIDLESERVVGRTDLQNLDLGGGGMAVDQESLWVTTPGNVFRINGQTDEIEATIEVDGNAIDVAIGLGAVWVMTEEPAALLRIDPASNLVTGVLELSTSPCECGLEIGDDVIWVRVHDSLLKIAPGG